MWRFRCFCRRMTACLKATETSARGGSEVRCLLLMVTSTRPVTTHDDTTKSTDPPPTFALRAASHPGQIQSSGGMARSQLSHTAVFWKRENAVFRVGGGCSFLCENRQTTQRFNEHRSHVVLTHCVPRITSLNGMPRKIVADGARYICWI